jgi:hypothetical protein
MQIQSPSGHTDHAIEYVTRRLTKAGMQPVFTNKGGVLVTIKGENDTQHRFVTAHVDTLGAMVKEIKEDGALKIEQNRAGLVGFPWTGPIALWRREKERCLPEPSSLPIRRFMFIMMPKNKNAPMRTWKSGWMCGPAPGKRLRRLASGWGTLFHLTRPLSKRDTGFVKARHLDDKSQCGRHAGAFKTFERIRGETALYHPFFISATSKKWALGRMPGSRSLFANTCRLTWGRPGKGRHRMNLACPFVPKTVRGPYHYGLTNHLIRLAEEHHIAYQVDIYPHYASDASAAVRAGYDVKHALIGPGVDASHAYERDASGCFGKHVSAFVSLFAFKHGVNRVCEPWPCGFLRTACF